jgi:hypothetical protein
MKSFRILIALFAALLTLTLSLPAQSAETFTITKLSVYDSRSGEGGAEISSYHKATKQVYITNGRLNRIEIVSIKDPSSPTLVNSVDMTQFGDNITSVAAGKSVVAVAVHQSAAFAADGTPTLRNGNLVVLTPAGKIIRAIDLGGVQPDSVSFTPDGLTALVAIEGEPVCAKNNPDTPADESLDYAFAKDPQGAVAIVDLRKPKSATVRLVNFSKFTAEGLKQKGLVMSLTSKQADLDLEPEYISAASDSIAYVTLQEANAIAEIDLKKAKVLQIFSAGTTDVASTAFDLSDRDSLAGPATYPNVMALAMPDAIATFTSGKDTFAVTANEGDDRADWTCFKAVDDKRAKDLKVDTTVFTDWDAIKVDAKLGRAKVNPNIGDNNGDGLLEKIYLLSNRSFSIFKNGQRIYDSGNLLEQLQIDALGLANINGEWNLTSGAYSAQGVAVGSVGKSRIAVVGLERMSALLFLDITKPAKPVVIKWEQMLPLSTIVPGSEGLTWSPEGLVFVDAKDSPNGKPLVITSYEVSGTLSIHQIESKK